MVRISIIGDFDGRPTHMATNAALQHAADALGIGLQSQWCSTDELLQSTSPLAESHGFIGAPGGPYKNLDGAVSGIQYVRQNSLPFLGTCAGFQHAVLEYARNALHLKANHQEVTGNEADALVVPLSCDLKGIETTIRVDIGSRAFSLYETATIREKFRCSYGLNANAFELFDRSEFHPAGFDENRQTVIMELAKHPFFIATLFQPQLSSLPEKPHPLFLGFLRAAANG